MKDIKEEVLKQIKPTKQEEENIDTKVKRFVDKLNRNLSGARVIIGGSFAKGTWLRGDHDIDLFAIFDNDEDISEKLYTGLVKSFSKIIRVHGSRDYFNVMEYGLNFEVVPVFRTEKSREAHNITDVSPLHVKWVRSNIDGGLVDEIRLAKQFCKAQNVYGAETFIKGFSGYALEILTIFYGSFDKLVEAATKWNLWETINVSGRNDAVINKDKLSPLVVIDPVQEDRNTTAALSIDKFYSFINSCKLYMNNPNKKFFEIKRIKLADLKNKDLVIEAEGAEGTRDVVGTKLFVAYQRIRDLLMSEGFIIKDSGWSWNEKCFYWFDVKNKELSKFREHQGPPLEYREHVEEFRKKHIGHKLVEEEDRIYAMIARKHTKLKDYARYIVKVDEEITKRVKSIRVV